MTRTSKIPCKSTVTLTLESSPWVKVMTHRLTTRNIHAKYEAPQTKDKDNMVRTRKFHASLLWPWPWGRDLGSKSVHTVSPQGTFMPNMKLHKWRIGKIWSGQKNSMQVYRDLDLGNVTLGQGHDTPSQHKEHLCQIWKCNYNTLRKYGPDKLTDRRTDGRTDKQTDAQTTPYHNTSRLKSGV